MNRYVLGFDFGTLSCRGVVLNVETGELCVTAEDAYRRGVITGKLPEADISLPDEWCLQDPDDWLFSMRKICGDMLDRAGVNPDQVIGLGVDFTSCTLLPVKKDGTVLCQIPAFRDDPNAWPKLWKHHGAQNQAERLENYAAVNTDWLKDYFGNSVSSEWAYPKMLQVLEESPKAYEAADYFIEGMDYIPMLLTGEVTRNNGVLGVNFFYIEGRGFPDDSFAAGVNPSFRNVVKEKLGGRILKPGELVGTVKPEMARFLGVSEKTVVSVGNSDGAIAGCGAGVNESGSMMLVVGTSTCHQMMYDRYVPFDGICSIAADGMVPGLYGYESGQPATGDLFSWFAKNCAPESVTQQASCRGMSVLDYLNDEAQKLLPGECGLVTIDWLSGNRSILSNYDLSGAMIGLTLETTPVDMYRSLVEANVYGTRMIIENYELHGVHIDRIYAIGGISRKCPWIMQMIADVLRSDIIVPQFDNVPAYGAAATAAVAAYQAGIEYGCRDFNETAKRLIPKETIVYHPDLSKSVMYDEVYEQYRVLHDYFGLDSTFMKKVKEIKVNRKKQKTEKEDET